MTPAQGKTVWKPCLALAAALAASCALSLFAGAVRVPAGESLVASLVRFDVGAARGHAAEFFASPVIQLRTARILMAIAAGAGLSVAGVVFQALLRNPLADPYVLGVSSGAGLGAAVAIILGFTALGTWTLPGMAFAGALATIFLVYGLARRAGGAVPVHTLLLSGVIVGAVFNSILMFLVTASTAERLHNVLWWLLGNLQTFDWALLAAVGTVVLFGAAATALFARDLNTIVLGEEPAAHLGMSVERTKVAFFLLGSLLTGAVVAGCGLIGFVGLIVPHAVRLALGPDHRRLAPASALAGAAFLVLADMFARTALSPQEIPIGVVTSFLGGPFFLYLLRTRRRGQWA